MSLQGGDISAIREQFNALKSMLDKYDENSISRPIDDPPAPIVAVQSNECPSGLVKCDPRRMQQLYGAECPSEKTSPQIVTKDNLHCYTQERIDQAIREGEDVLGKSNTIAKIAKEVTKYIAMLTRMFTTTVKQVVPANATAATTQKMCKIIGDGIKQHPGDPLMLHSMCDKMPNPSIPGKNFECTSSGVGNSQEDVLNNDPQVQALFKQILSESDDGKKEMYANQILMKLQNTLINKGEEGTDKFMCVSNTLDRSFSKGERERIFNMASEKYGNVSSSGNAVVMSEVKLRADNIFDQQNTTTQSEGVGNLSAEFETPSDVESDEETVDANDFSSILPQTPARNE